MAFDDEPADVDGGTGVTVRDEGLPGWGECVRHTHSALEVLPEQADRLQQLSTT
jgi:hypothetical protein